MAKIRPSSFAASVSGSVAGLTFRKDRHTLTLRAKARPVKPSAPRQALTQARFAAAVKAWRGLTATQRREWNQQAAPSTSGFATFASSYALLEATSMSTIVSPSTEPTVPSIVVASSGTPSAAGSWFLWAPRSAGTASTFQLQATRPHSAGISSVKGMAFRTIDLSLPATAVVPPTPYKTTILAVGSLTHFWPMDEAAGSTQILDAKGSLNSASLGGVSLGGAKILANLGTSAGFIAPSQFITMAGDVTRTANYTYEWAMKPATNGLNTEYMFWSGSKAPGFTPQDFIFSDGQHKLVGHPGPTTTPANSFPTNTAVLSQITYDGTNVRLYRNGTLVVTEAHSLPAWSALTMLLGAYTFSNNIPQSDLGYGGLYSNLAIYNVALDAATCLAHYNQAIATAGAGTDERIPYEAAYFPITSRNNGQAITWRARAVDAGGRAGSWTYVTTLIS